MNSIFNDPGFWHRLQFGFTIVYHYLFPQLTMGLAWFLVYWKWRALRTGDEKYNQAVRFWAKIFGLNFALGVVTGIPMEFQFGTNWADFSKYAGGVIGQTLAMEGMFAFFLESAFVGALIWGEKRLGPRGHFAAALAVALGWLSDRSERLVRHRQHERLFVESVGVCAVRSQPIGGGCDRLVCRCCNRSVLRVARCSSSPSQTLFARRNVRGPDRIAACCFSDG